VAEDLRSQGSRGLLPGGDHVGEDADVDRHVILDLEYVLAHQDHDGVNSGVPVSAVAEAVNRGAVGAVIADVVPVRDDGQLSPFVACYGRRASVGRVHALLVEAAHVKRGLAALGMAVNGDRLALERRGNCKDVGLP
jgi:hypothetical protein